MMGGVDTFPWFWINGEPGQSMQGNRMKQSIGDFVVRVSKENKHKRKIVVNLGDGELLQIKSFDDFVRVDLVGNVHAKNYAGSLGMMGSYPDGRMVARDNSTMFSVDDVNAFGQEWQVLPSEPHLFHNVEGVQPPQKCAMPDATAKKRRLGESWLSMEKAEIACAHVMDQMDQIACVEDVLATNNVEMAGAY